MPRIAWTACVIALCWPALAIAGERGADAKPAQSKPDPKPDAEPSEAAALAAARTNMDQLLQELLTQPSDAAPAESTALQLEVVPPALTSEPKAAVLRPEPGSELEWLHGVELPDIPVRWHDQLLQLLAYYRDDPRGRAHIRGWLQRSGRYEAMIRKKLAEAGMPRDLMYIAMVESGFDPVVQSSASAVGLWQLVATTASEYGLDKSRWLDDRRNPERATDAAIAYLKQLHDRLGSWPLSLAAFNMGYSGLLRSVRKYNTNDYWLLARLEAGLPYETVVYVAKVMACAIVAHNPERFGLGDVVKDPPLQFATVQVPGGSTLARLASAASISSSDLARWNPELLHQRVPPDVKQWGLRLPVASSAQFARRWPQLQTEEPRNTTHVLRFGEGLDDVAQLYGTTARKLRVLNDLSEDDNLEPGLRLKVPSVAPEARRDADLPVVAIPRLSFSYPSRRHIFYRVQEGDRAERIAKFFKVEMRELRLWNAISPDASLHEGMTLQLYVPSDVDLSRAVYLTPEKARVLVVGSPEFLDYHEGLRDRVRVRYKVKPGDTLSTLAERFDLSVGSICRINGFDRDHALAADSELILYTKVREPAPGTPVATKLGASQPAPAKAVTPRAGPRGPSAAKPATTQPSPAKPAPAKATAGNRSEPRHAAGR